MLGALTTAQHKLGFQPVFEVLGETHLKMNVNVVHFVMSTEKGEIEEVTIEGGHESQCGVGLYGTVGGTGEYHPLCLLFKGVVVLALFLSGCSKRTGTISCSSI